MAENVEERRKEWLMEINEGERNEGQTMSRQLEMSKRSYQWAIL